MENFFEKSLVLKKHHHIMSYQKMKEAMLSLLMDPALWYETIRGGKLLCGVPHNESLRSLKEKKSGLYCVSIVTPGWWLMPYEGGYSNGRRPIGNARVNPFGLLRCGRTSPHGEKTWL